jgi:hypothetical protein
MSDPTDADLDAALARGRRARASEPRAVRARYDKRSGRVVVDLANGCVFAFPAALGEGLAGLGAQELAQVEIAAAGYGLRWESADVDLSVPGLVAGLFGARAHMARLAGRATSPAKARAARRNGARGGRPRKSA